MTLEMTLDARDFQLAPRGLRRNTALGRIRLSPTPIITPVVRQKIEDHGLKVEEVERVLAAPEQHVPGYGGRLILQSKVDRFLIRVVIEPDCDPPEVVTAYRTSKVEKYWQVDDAD